MNERIELKAHNVLISITKLCNEGHKVGFVADWGDNTLTVTVDDRHTHVGNYGGSEKFLIESLHSLFCKDQGLSWVKTDESKETNPKEI